MNQHFTIGKHHTCKINTWVHLSVGKHNFGKCRTWWAAVIFGSTRFFCGHKHETWQEARQAAEDGLVQMLAKTLEDIA